MQNYFLAVKEFHNVAAKLQFIAVPHETHFRL